MLAFGFKVAWFILSLTGQSSFPVKPPSRTEDLLGFLSSIAAVPAFAEALNGYLFPVLYCLANFVLQGMFCLGESGTPSGADWEANVIARGRYNMEDESD